MKVVFDICHLGEKPAKKTFKSFTRVHIHIALGQNE